MGKVETDTQPINGLRYRERPIFIQSWCDLLFLTSDGVKAAERSGEYG